MRIISWNVNGIRATAGKIKDGRKIGSPTNNVITTLIEEQKPDVLCFQEVKTQNENDLTFLKPHYKYILTNFSKYKKGYSGVALLTNEKPHWVSYDFNSYTEDEIGPYNSYEFTSEGRLITARLKNCIVVTAYIPNSQPELARLDERTKWEVMIRLYLQLLKRDNSVAVIYIGDLNVTPTSIDIHNDKNKKNIPGASPQERAEFKKLIECGFVDSYRYLYPDSIKYTYFSNFMNARERNMGWRIDIALVDDTHRETIKNADCLCEYFGSDHVPVLIDIDV
jgi:exodeoxyribonuclease III